MAEGLPGTNLVSSTWEADPEPSEIQGQPRGLETLSCKKKIPLKHWQASPSCPTFYVPNRQGPETLCPPPSLAQPRLSLLQQLQCLNASPLAAMMGALQCPPFTWMPSPASLSENPDMLRHRRQGLPGWGGRSAEARVRDRAEALPASPPALSSQWSWDGTRAM